MDEMGRIETTDQAVTQDELRAHRALKEKMAILRDVEPPASLQRNIIDRTVRRRRGRVILVSAIAVLILLLAGIFLIVPYQNHERTKEDANKLFEAITETSVPFENSSYMLLNALMFTAETASQNYAREVAYDEGI